MEKNNVSILNCLFFCDTGHATCKYAEKEGRSYCRSYCDQIVCIYSRNREPDNSNIKHIHHHRNTNIFEYFTFFNKYFLILLLVNH